MSKGRVYRRCYCRDENGRDLGQGCPVPASDRKHGSWTFAVDVPNVENRRKTTSGITAELYGHLTKEAALTAADSLGAVLDAAAAEMANEHAAGQRWSRLGNRTSDLLITRRPDHAHYGIYQRHSCSSHIFECTSSTVRPEFATRLIPPLRTTARPLVAEPRAGRA
jgi:hypothetical protein